MFKESTWKDGEKRVQDHMKRKGYKIIYTNFSCVGVELDIVAVMPRKVQIRNLKREFKQKMIDDRSRKSMYGHSLASSIRLVEDILVITEVKARETDKYGLGMDAVSDYKKHNLTRGARYLQKDKRFEKMQIRFDVASVDGGEITYIENVF